MKHRWISDETSVDFWWNICGFLMKHICLRTVKYWLVSVNTCVYLTKRICLGPLRCGLVSVSTYFWQNASVSDHSDVGWSLSAPVYFWQKCICLGTLRCWSTSSPVSVWQYTSVLNQLLNTWILIRVRLSVPVSHPYPGKYKNIKRTGSTRECCSYGCYSLTPVRPSKFMVDKMLRLKEKSKPAGHLASAHHPQAALQLKMLSLKEQVKPCWSPRLSASPTGCFAAKNVKFKGTN